ncbi:MAG: ribosome biogenesis GTP-binding protein YihA/YsxC [Lachnospiraceae bacterium]|nr:YihA family ribosome biogenesis GTP-binding protein [Lachnospiraceae bacterium]MCR5390210.1 ribosome biogenesis GTP-binding protein YihA/YsxC [Lachnospiraceae bacterium]
MIIKKALLETVIGTRSEIPVHELPEFAFAGKSNVGKSSLINAIMQRKSLARTSSEPGKTRTINYYNVNDALYLVDLPGYGYSKAGKEEAASWGRMVERYLHGSKVLKQVFLLVDIRHAPGANDCQMYEWIEAQGFEPVIIATKLDKINRSQTQKQLKLLRTTLGCKDALMIPFSAKTKQGLEEIYALFESCD